MLKSMLVTSFVICAAAAQAEPRTWDPIPLKGKEAKSVSGAACADAPKRCVIVSDEVTWARKVSLKDHGFEVGDPIPLLAGDEEADAEGIAYAGGQPGSQYYYVTGSHGVSKPSWDTGVRVDGVPKPARNHVFRIGVDPVTGRATSDMSKSDLTVLLKDLPGIGGSVGGQLDRNGLNIEGLAVKQGDLYFGLRGPVIGDAAQVVRIPINVLFGGAQSAPQPYAVTLKGKMGIRDLVAVQDGFLILSGPSAPELKGAPATAAPPTEVHIYFWKPGAPPTCRQKVPYSLKAKPEGLLVLKDEGLKSEVLVLSDEAEGAAPMVYNLSDSDGACA